MHNGKHPNKYFEKVNRLLQEADELGGKQAVLDKLDDIRNTLQSAARDTHLGKMCCQDFNIKEKNDKNL